MKTKRLFGLRHFLVMLLVSVTGVAFLLCGSWSRAPRSGPSSQPLKRALAQSAVAAAPTLPSPSPAGVPAPSPAGQLNLPANVQMHRLTEDAPKWAVGFGKEFWRRPAVQETPIKARPGETNVALPASLNLGDVIERVHHAIAADTDAPLPQTRARTYTASFDGEGLRFSPHRPAKEAPKSADDNGERLSPAAAGGAASGTASPQDFGLRQSSGALAAGEGASRADESESGRGLPHSKTLARQSMPQPDPATEARFRTVSVRREGAALFEIRNPESAIRNSPWSLLGNTAQSLLNAEAGLIEHYEAREEGVAVTWVLERAPAGNGPLVVETELAGLNYAVESAHGHHFADASGTPRVRVGNVTVVDAAGQRWEATTTAAGSLQRVTVPETILAQATYPLAIDPLIGPEFEMDAPVIGPSGEANREFKPQVAFNGVNHLVVWEEDRDSLTGLDLYAVRVNRLGGVLDSISIPVSKAARHQWNPRVASDGTDWFVVWQDERASSVGEGDIYGCRVTAAGLVIDGGGLAIATGPSNQRTPRIACNGNNYLVVWRLPRPDPSTFLGSTEGTIVGLNGVVLGPAISIPGSNGDVSLASDGTDYLLVFGSDSPPVGIYGVRVTGGGRINSAQFPINTSASAPRGESSGLPEVAWNGHEFLAAWNDLRNDPTHFIYDIYGARISQAGTLLDFGGFAISTAADNQVVPKISAVGGEFLVVWGDGRNGGGNDYDIYGARVRADGTVRDPAGLPININPGDQRIPNVASDNIATYLVVYASRQTGIPRAVGNTVSPDPPVIISEPPQVVSVALGGSITFSVTASGAGPLSYQWFLGGAPIDDPGARTSTYTINDVQFSHSGLYSNMVCDVVGSCVMRGYYRLFVLNPPVITIQPEDRQRHPGDDVQFRVVATGRQPLRYQWRFKGANNPVPVDVPGANSDTYDRYDLKLEDNGEYSVVVANADGSVTSDPATLTVFDGPAIVVPPGSPDPGTFGAAIIAANANPAPSLIVIDTSAGLQTINLQTALPAITAPVWIDARRFVAGGGGAGFAAAAGSIPVPGTVLNGASTAPGAHGLHITTNNCVIRGLVIQNFSGHGILLSNASGCVLEGNYIGTDATGTTRMANGLEGIHLENAVSNTIATCVIAGNRGHGVLLINSPGTVIRQNRIGNGPGSPPAPMNNSGHGIFVVDSPGVRIDDGNVIGPNSGAGVRLVGATTRDCVVQRNYIGVDSGGAAMLGNGSAGVSLLDASSNQIGGPGLNAPNWIAYNAVGVTVAGSRATNNTIRFNSIKSNAGLGIDLGENELTANDAGDPDTGPNGFQNFPALTQVTAWPPWVNIQGMLNSRVSTSYTLDFYANGACDASGSGEGDAHLGAATVTTDSSGHAVFNVTLPVTLQGAPMITATATDAAGNTSEFSPCREADTNRPRIVINEWMALDVFEDWIELYNPNDFPVDLGGCSLTDDLGNPLKSPIPSDGFRIVPPKGFLLVVADAYPEGTSPSTLHVNFMLNGARESIGLFAPDGTAIDTVTFTNQLYGVTEGRFPDGGVTREFLARPTPLAPNVACPTNGPLVVTVSDEYGPGSLRHMIACAVPGRTITFASDFTNLIRLAAGELVINKDLTIVGPGANRLSIQTTNSRIFRIDSGRVTISGLNISGVVAGVDGADTGNAGEDGGAGGDAEGGGILNFGDLTLTDCMVRNCRAYGGMGGMGGANFLLLQPGAGGAGGAARGAGICNRGTLRLLRCALANNRAYAGDGGTGGDDYNGNASNSGGRGGAGGHAVGGGVYNAGTLFATNCSVVANISTGASGGRGGAGSPGGGRGGDGGAGLGGGFGDQGTGTIVSCTFTDNEALPGFYGTGGSGSGFPGGQGLDGLGAGGGIYSDDVAPHLFVRNSLTAGNISSFFSDAAGGLLSGGFNFVGVFSDGAVTLNPFTQPSDIVGISPTVLNARFGAFDDFGGTTLVQSLLQNSPAVDKGHRSGDGADQRGAARPEDLPFVLNGPGGDGSDIGAYEYGASVRPPGLSIRLGVPQGGFNTVILSWPNPSNGYVLQQTANMSGSGGGWTDVTQTPIVNGANKEVTLLATGQFCLFRLRQL